MNRLSVYCVVFLAVFNILINAAVVVNKSPKDLASQTRTETLVLRFKTAKPAPTEASGYKLSRKDRCCNLGREVAKIGETCTYSPNVDHIYPNSHYHQMKTSVWTRRSHPIKRRLLQKCKLYKSFYQKCCFDECALITKDLIEAKRKIKQFLRELRKNKAGEDEGSASEQGGLQEKQKRTKRHKYSS